MKFFAGYGKITILLLPLLLFGLTASADAKSLLLITVAPSSFTLSANETVQFSATAIYSDGTTADITSSATWTSDSSACATVSSSGLVEGIAKGTTTIRADNAGIEGTATVSVASRLSTTNYTIIRNSHFGASAAPFVATQNEGWANFADLGVHYMRMPMNVGKNMVIDNTFLTQYDGYVTSGQTYGLIMYGIVNPVSTNGQWDTAANFAGNFSTVVKRYDGTGSNNMSGLLYPVKNWEICNEIRYDSACSSDPNCSWNGFTKANYLDFMAQSNTALKAACSDCNFLNGAEVAPPSVSIASTGSSPLVDVVQSKGTSIIDAISYHDYKNNLESDTAVADFASYGLQNKPVWATETDMQNEYNLNNSLTQDDSARLMARSFAYALYKGFSKLIYTDMRASTSDQSFVQWGSLLDPTTGSKRKSYYAYKKLIEKLDYFSSATTASPHNGSTIFAFTFTVKGSPVYVLWATSNQTVSLNLSSSSIAGVKITQSVPSDSNGTFATQYVPATGGVAAINLSTTAVYVEELKSYPFGDASSGNWAYNYINAIYNAGITTGCGSDTYCPTNTVTRGQMAAFIIRANYGENFSYTQTSYFSDVPTTNVFFKYVQRLKDDGITSVTGTYNIDGTETRGQMAAFIIRAKYGENFTYNTTPYFTDVPSSNTFFKYVQRLKDDGITTATSVYNVDSNVTRDQMAAFLSRAFLGAQ